jgi:hypothetical protein
VHFQFDLVRNWAASTAPSEWMCESERPDPNAKVQVHSDHGNHVRVSDLEPIKKVPALEVQNSQHAPATEM